MTPWRSRSIRNNPSFWHARAHGVIDAADIAAAERLAAQAEAELAAQEQREAEVIDGDVVREVETQPIVDGEEATAGTEAVAEPVQEEAPAKPSRRGRAAKEPKEPKRARESKESKESKERGAKAAKEPKEPRDRKTASKPKTSRKKVAVAADA
jgi:hypothetical protein